MFRPNVCLGLAVALVLTCAQPSAAESPEREQRIVDVAEFEPIHYPQLRRNLWGKLMFRVRPSRDNSEEVFEDPDEGNASQGYSPENVAEILAATASEIDDEFEIEVEGSMVSLRGTPDSLQRAMDTLEILRRAVGSPARVEVDDLLLPDDVTVPAVVDAGALETLRREDHHGGTRRLSFDMDHGCWRLAESVTGARRVIDIDVEIAEDAAIGDPVVARVEEGVRVLARGAPLTDGRFVMRVLASTGSLLDRPRRLALGQDELGEVDLPDLDAGFVSTEFVLTAGRAQTIVLDRPDGDQRVLVFRLVEAPIARIGGTLRAFPLGAFSAPQPMVALRMSDDPVNDEGSSLSLSERDRGIRFSGDFVSNSIERALIEDFEEDRARGDYLEWVMGGAFLIRGPSDSLDQAHAVVAELEAATFRQKQLTIRFEERGPDGEPARVIGRVATPVTVGFASSLAAYRHVAFVADYDVEVAQKAQISDPTVGAALAGILANVTVAEAGRRGHIVRAELRVSAFDGPHGRGFGATDVGALETVIEASRYAESRVRTTSAQPGEISMGQSPFDEGARLVAVITVE